MYIFFSVRSSSLSNLLLPLRIAYFFCVFTKSRIQSVVFFLNFFDHVFVFRTILFGLILLLLFTRLKVSTSVLADCFSLEFEQQQVSWTRLRILAVLSNTVIWIVSARPLTSKSSRPYNNPLVIVSKHPSQLVQSSLSCYTAFLILSQS